MEYIRSYHDMMVAAMVDEALSAADREHAIIQNTETGLWELYMPATEEADDDK